MKILADATLPKLSALFAGPFTVTTYHSAAELTDLIKSHEILLCRSTLKVGVDLLSNTPIKCVATASSGIDHIDSDYLQQHGITLFDAKGCNAPAVADYVIATLALLQNTLGLKHQKAGIIGLGEVGSRVAKRLKAAGLDVIYFDPIKAQTDSNNQYCTLQELADCDLLCVHANLHYTRPYPSDNLFDSKLISQLKPGTTLINAARGGIVNEEALLNATNPIIYCADVYQQEPAIDARIINFATFCTPHIAGHSIEAKLAAVINLSKQLHHYIGAAMPPLYSLMDREEQLINQTNWQEYVLSLYNPLAETSRFKAAKDKTAAFLELRRQHHRHDFTHYNARRLDRTIQLLLGNG